MKLLQFFQENGVEKNILLLGQSGCGKRSFVLRYKDGTFLSERLPEMQNIIYAKKMGVEQKILDFLFDLSNHGMTSVFKEKKIDLILILTNLSSEHAQHDLKSYTKFAATHFPGVDTLHIGTKSDIQLAENKFDGVIVCSAKTGQGFEEFDERLLQILNLNNEALSHKRS
jgi:GTPase SAR1 family protein